jgi:recombinational DNA repair ATPase RecF
LLQRQNRQLASTLEEESQKRNALQTELKMAQQQNSQLKVSEKQLSKVSHEMYKNRKFCYLNSSKLTN